MSERNITYLTNACLITCIVEMGSAEKVLEAAKNSGAQGATINYARGTGIREKLGLLGVTIDEQKEIIRVIVSEEQSEIVFEAMYLAGELDKPGKGIMYLSELDKVATYIPDSVIKNLKWSDKGGIFGQIDCFFLQRTINKLKLNYLIG